MSSIAKLLRSLPGIGSLLGDHSVIPVRQLVLVAPANLFLDRLWSGGGFATSTAPGAGTTLNSKLAGEDGFYQIVATASLVNAVAAIQPIVFRITDELPGVLYEEEQSLEETVQLNARWEMIAFLKTNWAVRLVNRTAFGVGETIETEINLLRLLQP